MRIAILGTRGIPASYGGFETFAEHLATRLVARGHRHGVLSCSLRFAATVGVSRRQAGGFAYDQTQVLRYRYPYFSFCDSRGFRSLRRCSDLQLRKRAV